MIIAYFNLPGNMPVFNIVLQMYVSGDTMYGVLSFNNLVEFHNSIIV